MWRRKRQDAEAAKASEPPRLKDALRKPLATTLAAKTPLPKTIPAREIRTIDSVTEPRVYSFTLSQAQQGDAILVLAPLPA